MNTWAEIPCIGVTEITVITTGRMHNPGSSDHSASVNNTRVLRKQNGMNCSEDLDAPKELNEAYKEVTHVVSPFKDNSVQDGTRNKEIKNERKNVGKNERQKERNR